MVPSTFVFLDAMPLTPNGKVDRRALPLPDGARPEMGESFVAPGTPLEEVLAGIWSEILGIEQVGIYDNFFELGGHSLLATQVISQLRDTFQINLPISRLFETPTVAGLAEALLKDPHDRVKVEKIAQYLIRLAQFSDEDVEKLLEEKINRQ
ncbi:MAG: phosphopantetheine-binding protein, partial [Planctomycetota bacterium]|jgi:acyl carrier protein